MKIIVSSNQHNFISNAVSLLVDLQQILFTGTFPLLYSPPTADPPTLIPSLLYSGFSQTYLSVYLLVPPRPFAAKLSRMDGWNYSRNYSRAYFFPPVNHS